MLDRVKADISVAQKKTTLLGTSLNRLKQRGMINMGTYHYHLYTYILHELII